MILDDVKMDILKTKSFILEHSHIRIASYSHHCSQTPTDQPKPLYSHMQDHHFSSQPSSHIHDPSCHLNTPTF